MTRYRVLPYKQGSRSARALAEALGGKVLRLENSTFVPTDDDVVINWGSSRGSKRTHPGLINDPQKVFLASNKRVFFETVGTSNPDIIPEFWTDRAAIPADAYPVVCRTILNGHSGAGIVIASNPTELVDAPLYVRYIKKQDEYRVHVGRGRGAHAAYTTIAIQKKARRRDTEEVNWLIRNHSNGFVYVRNGINPPACVIAVAVQALVASDLDFGAVDVLYNEKQDKAYALEINTAPGLEGQTVIDYAEFFQGRSVGSWD